MKNKILAIILCLVLVVSAFSGCGLVSLNEEKTNVEPVVTIGSGKFQQTITESEIFNTFYQYVYYVMYGGVSIEQAIDLAVDQLVNSKIVTILALENMPIVKDRAGDLYGSYLTDAEIAEIEKKVDSAISAQIDNLEAEAIREKAEIEKASVRPVPTSFVYQTQVPVDFIDTDTRNSAMRSFELQIISNGQTYDSYVETYMNAYKTSKLVEKYQDSIMGEVDATEADINARFNAIIEAEKEAYAINTKAFADKLKAASSAKDFGASNFPIYAPETGFGFGLNLLLSFSDEDVEKVKELNEKLDNEEISQEEFESAREELALNMTISDLRADWLKEYGDSTTLFDELAFFGSFEAEKVNGVQVRDDEGNFAYSSITPTEYNLTSFLNMLSANLGATASGKIGDYDTYLADSSKADLFMQYVWAFSGDPGSLNNNVGYVLHKNPDESGYVEEFAEATALLAQTTEGTYVVNITDYGVHIVFLTKAYDAVGVNDNYSAEEAKTEGTFSYTFKNSIEKSVKENYFQEKVSSLSVPYVSDKKFVSVDDEKMTKLITSLYSMLQQ